MGRGGRADADTPGCVCVCVCAGGWGWLQEWEANLRVAWIMVSVLLGLVVGQSGLGWVRVGLHAAIGVTRCVLVAVDPYMFERMYDNKRYKTGYQLRLAQDSMFRVDRL